MKLATDIQPRRDGTVTAEAQSGNKYVFKDDGTGLLVADVSEKTDQRFLLDAGFYPADEADIPSGIKVAVNSGEDTGAGVTTGEEQGGDNAAPIEANTPPKKKK